MKRAVVTFTSGSGMNEEVKFESVGKVDLDGEWLLFEDGTGSTLGGVPSKRVVSWRIEEVKD